jgi:MFS superfamily sulfate permease-like transporter
MRGMNQAAPQAQWISFAISAIIVSAVLAFRVNRMRRARPLKIERLWIVPLLYLAVASTMFWHQPPIGMGWLYCAVALVLGGATGWQRGRFMRIEVDPETHEISQQASIAAMLFILGLILVRTAAREAAQMNGMPVHLDIAVVTDVLVAFALGLLSVQRLEMYLRARRLLDAARAARAARA